MRRALIIIALAASARASSAADGPAFCGTCANGGAPPMANTMLSIACQDSSQTITAVQFASYGTPSGSCGKWSVGACNAANSTSVVTAACVGKSSCVVYPNTTTFGDPCFGTAKVLSVQLTCSGGSAGSATCAVPPTPPLANFSATLTVAWAAPNPLPLLIEPSVQVVSQHLLYRDSPIHDQSFATLKQLGARNIRFVPWIPYPAYGVGELQPPSGSALCGPSSWALGGQTLPVTLDCGAAGGTIASVTFASFGTPGGTCGAYTVNQGCSAANSTSVVESLCVGKRSCSIPTAPGPSNPFGQPCASNTATYLAVQVTCSNPDARFSYWNLTLPDALFSDFWNAVDGNNSEPIPNFSTQPTWLYDATDYSWPENPDTPWYGYDRGTAPASNLTALGDYYGCLYGYFITNQLTDEYGNVYTRTSGPPLNISIIEVFNEVDYEHGHTPQSYTLDFDAVVKGIRAHADPEKRIRYVGLTLPNIDPTDKVVAWAQFFLNASNHDSDTVDALNFIGFHAYPTNGGYSPDPTTFAGLFTYVDEFVTKVQAVDAVIAALSPSTKTVLDETGTDMDGVLEPNTPPPANNPRYWVAAAGYFAYMFARVATTSPTVVQIGASQLMDAPGQEPSVTLLDWSTGLGTARFWVVKMLIDTTDVGDLLPPTNATATGGGASATDLFAQALVAADGTSSKRVLLVNKRNAYVSVDASGACPAVAEGGAAATCTCSSALVIDEYTGLSPARTDACMSGPAGGPGITLAPYATAVLQFA
jgi:hypothetical protein